MKKSPLLTALAVVTLLFLLAPTASAIIACEDCESGDGNARCIGICNGFPIFFCSDWFFYGCGSFAPTSNPFDTIFPWSSFVPSEAETAVTPLDGGEACRLPADD